MLRNGCFSNLPFIFKIYFFKHFFCQIKTVKILKRVIFYNLNCIFVFINTQIMKKLIIFLGSFCLLIVSSCEEGHNITERYIKNNIETHTDGNFSAIKISSIFAATSLDGAAYIEFTAYNFNNLKGLIIGADKHYADRHRSNSGMAMLPPANFVQLNQDQCKAILDNYKSLLQKLNGDRAKYDETVYEDYTVSKDLYISYSKGGNGFGNISMSLWVKGEKFTMPTSALVNALNKFIKY